MYNLLGYCKNYSKTSGSLWNYYRDELTDHTKDRTSFSVYYPPKMEIKNFNVLTDGKSFFDIPVKNKEEAYEQTIEISRNNDYTTGNLLDYGYFSKHFKLIAIDLSKKIELKNLDLKQQINFI